jgi:hypothetical protein
MGRAERSLIRPWPRRSVVDGFDDVHVRSHLVVVEGAAWH